jgi:hypothetical protein
MKADPVLKELWEIKDDLSKECGHDLRRLFDHLKASQKSLTGRIVDRTKDRPKAISTR